MRYATFADMIGATRDRFRIAGEYMPPTSWQSVDVSKRREAATVELVNLFDTVAFVPHDRDALQQLIKPNLPWADEHFDERVSGVGMNPAPSWERWPWGNSAKAFVKGGVFSHTYPERMWPKGAHTKVPTYNQATGIYEEKPVGVRYSVGDLSDVVNLLAAQPFTRQAFLPIWFPEDTGVVHGERVPCTLGYHFMRRGDQLHCWYFIRSCDLMRHYLDDIYLAVRLQLWLIGQLTAWNKSWSFVKPGSFNMWIGSLHCFIGDYFSLFGEPFPRMPEAGQ